MEKPSRYVKLFNNDMPIKASVTQPHDPPWDLEVVDDWPYNVAKNLRSMAIDVGRAAQLPFTPNLKPFGGALFFCHSLSQLEKVLATATVLSQGMFVTLNKWVPEVNTSDPMRSPKVGLLFQVFLLVDGISKHFSLPDLLVVA